MPSKKDEPAAPVAQAAETFTTTHFTGLSKREAAAIAALAGLAANPSYNEVVGLHVASRALELADALFEGLGWKA